MQCSDSQCQGDNRKTFSRPALPSPLYRVYRYLKRQGSASGMAGELVRRISSRLRSKHREGVPGPPSAEEVLNLQPGELVEVKSEREIVALLDKAGTFKGLQFLPVMGDSCGKRFRVYKRVESIYLEESRKRRKIRNTVLLEGSICQGLGLGCDRSCFFFWREAWLRRVDTSSGPAAS